MQEIRMEYFFIPILLQVQTNPGGKDVIVRQRIFSMNFEFLRLPVNDAIRFAELLETAAGNASNPPIDTEVVGEINGTYVRSLGTGKIRIRLSAKRRDTVRFAVRTKVGLKYQYSWPKLSADEARRFAKALREANMEAVT